MSIRIHDYGSRTRDKKFGAHEYFGGNSSSLILFPIFELLPVIIDIIDIDFDILILEIE
jgi:hypothetical protein